MLAYIFNVPVILFSDEFFALFFTPFSPKEEPTMKKMLFGLLAVLAVSALCHADELDVDGRVKYLFDKNEYKYELSKDGGFKVTIGFNDDNDRSQLVFITSTTETVDDVEIREIYSFAADTAKITADMAMEMLTTNGKTKIGAWETTDDCDECIFTAKVPANIGFNELKTYINLVASIADNFEKKYCDGRDDY